VSAAGDIILALRGQGITDAAIARAIERDRSLVGQVRRGIKPGSNLVGALEELRDRLAAGGPVEGPVSAPPARRTNAKGRTARVRHKTTYAGRGWGSGAVKRQGVRSGAGILHRLVLQAAENGDELAVTVTFDKGVQVQGYGKGKRTRQGAGGVLDFQVDAEAAAAHIAAGGTFSDYVAGEAMRAGYISGQASAAAYTAHMTGLEVRAF
jgi:hypothetical protein